MEKRNGELTYLSKLSINNTVIEDEKKISQFVALFYKDLYVSKFVCSDFNNFLNSVKDKAKVIDDDFKMFCDDDLKFEEVIECIGNLKNNHSPGNDGLIIRALRQGVIILIPKPNKNIL